MEKILIIGEYTTANKDIQVILKRANYSVHFADKKLLGLKFLKENSYDTILVDSMMPCFAGLSMVDQIKKEGSKIIVIVDSLRDGTKNYLLDLLGREVLDVILETPISIEALVKAVKH